MDEFYTDKPDGVIGNEDCGQMSAWYVMSSMGFYQENPSDGVFVFGSPRFDKMTVKVRGNNTLIIEAENNSKENIYIQEVYFNQICDGSEAKQELRRSQRKSPAGSE